MQSKSCIGSIPSLSLEDYFSDYVTTFIATLEHEANAILQAARKASHVQIKQALAILLDCKGKAVLTGIGKSGLIARKIAATLTSTNTPALFLHPSDALHGDLGIATKGDIAIVFSNSGESEEILAMLPYLRNRQIPAIAIVGKLDSTLAKQATVAIYAGSDREACPLNLAPTSSTTVALAIGDALAVTLMQIKSITPEAFAVNHPAGRLGKRLTLRVNDLMHSEANNPVVRANIPWLEVVTAITNGGLGAVSVVEGEKLLGIITDGDVRRALQTYSPETWQTLTAAKLMTPNPVTVTTDTLAYDAMQIMEQRSSQISVLPVIDTEHRCIGMIRLHDIIRSGLA